MVNTLNHPKISIVTVTWNSSSTLRDTIESVLMQKYDNYEHIIIDGGSTDGTLELIEEYRPKYNGRLKCVSEHDNGIYDAMNKGIRMAEGDVMGTLNSDDFYASPDVLGYIADGCAECDTVCGDLVYVDWDDTSRIVRHWIGSPYRKNGFLKGWDPAHPTFYCRHELFNRFGLFDLDFGTAADFELMLRFVERNGATVKYIHHIFVRMRYGGESTRSIKAIMLGNKHRLRAFHKNGYKISPFYTVKRLVPKAWDMLKTRMGRHDADLQL